MRIPFFNSLGEKKRYVLVISGWGMRWFYGLWIAKALEELWYKDNIDAIYGVSAWGLLASYWAAWYNTEDILNKFLTWWWFIAEFANNINIIPKKSLLSNNIIKRQLERHLPKTFEELLIPTFIGCTDTRKGQASIISSWDLISALLGTIAIPWIFPAVERYDEVLIDGWVTNNFPIELAKKQFPNHKIIWISLNKYRKDPKIRNIIDTLAVSFEIMLRKDIERQWALADIFFCRSLGTPVLEFNATKLKKLYHLWYEDGIEMLANY